MELNKELIKRCLERCSTEEERKIVRYVVDDIELSKKWNDEAETASKYYGTILYQVLYGIEGLDVNKRAIEEFSSFIRFKNRNFLLMNELLHLIHTSFPEARGKGIEMVSDARACLNEKTYISASFRDYSTKMGEFPESLKEEVERAFAHIRDDIHLVYRTSWFHSHLDHGDDYEYMDNEVPIAEIYFPHEALSNQVENILNKHWDVCIEYY